MLHEEIQRIVMNSLELQEITDEATFVSSLDSIQKLNVLVALEDHYSIVIEPGVDEVLDSFQALVTAVEKRLLS